jgi:hypothetical protein
MLDFALGLLTLPLWDWSLLDAGRCENLIDQTQPGNGQATNKIK